MGNGVGISLLRSNKIIDYIIPYEKEREKGSFVLKIELNNERLYLS